MANAVARKSSRLTLRSSARAGWVGIDVGTTSIKVAQVEKAGSKFRLADCQLIPVTMSPGEVETTDVESVWPLNEIHRYRSRIVAATLPRNLTGFRTLQLPFATEHELRQLIQQELAETVDEELVFDFWTSDDGNPVRVNTREVSVASLPVNMANQFGRDLLSAGFTCQTIDATPFALARAVVLMTGRTTSSSVLAVDLGESATSITLVSDGRPVLFRELQDSGMQQISQALISGLGLSAADCQLLLRSPGLENQQPDGSVTELRRAINELTRKATDKVISELQRTFRFVKNNSQRNPPQLVVLFGAGAEMTGMDQLLSQALETRVKRWSMPSNADLSVPQHLVGQAAGLSALAVMS